MSVALRVLAVWLALNALLVAVWAWIGWFARRGRTDVRRRRAEIAFTTLGMAAILASLSLINPGVRHAVTPIVNSALGLTPAQEDRRQPPMEQHQCTVDADDGDKCHPLTEEHEDAAEDGGKQQRQNRQRGAEADRRNDREQ